MDESTMSNMYTWCTTHIPTSVASRWKQGSQNVCWLLKPAHHGALRFSLSQAEAEQMSKALSLCLPPWDCDTATPSLSESSAVQVLNDCRPVTSSVDGIFVSDPGSHFKFQINLCLHRIPKWGSLSLWPKKQERRESWKVARRVCTLEEAISWTHKSV